MGAPACDNSIKIFEKLEISLELAALFAKSIAGCFPALGEAWLVGADPLEIPWKHTGCSHLGRPRAELD